MQQFLEHLATAVSAISGVLAGRGKQVDLFGVVVLALVTAVGGGTLRDVILDVRPFWVLDPSYVMNATLAALLTFVVIRYRELPHHLLMIADAGGLALFTVLGTEKSLAMGAPPVVAVGLGVMTGVAGGILRDMLTGEIPLVFRPGIYLYATASLCGAILFVLIENSTQLPRLVAIGVTLLLRLAAIQWRLRLPVLKARDGIDSAGSRATDAR